MESKGIFVTGVDPIPEDMKTEESKPEDISVQETAPDEPVTAPYGGTGEPPSAEVVAMQEMTTQIRELKDELKELRLLLDDSPPEPIEPEPPAKQKKKFAWVWDVCFYLLLIALIAGAFLIRSSAGDKPFSFAGYSAFTVLTSSMEEVIPKGSLVITKSVDANTLQVGDDITYMSGPSSTITHRIIGIVDNYAQTNERAFITKGVMNPNADKEPIPAVNVVGKVVYHNKVLGDLANLVQRNWPFILFVVVVVVVLVYVLKRILREDPPAETRKKIKKAG